MNDRPHLRPQQWQWVWLASGSRRRCLVTPSSSDPPPPTAIPIFAAKAKDSPR